MMFEVTENEKAITDLPVITHNYTVLHYDELPILFTGLNAYGNNIVGSVMCEDDDNNTIRYIHIVVSERDHALFINRSISYLKLIQLQERAFLVDKDFSDRILAIYKVAVSEIPKDYLPLPTAFNPA